MFDPKFLELAGQFGIAGFMSTLFFVMWWVERRDRKTSLNAAMGWKAFTEELAHKNDVLVEVVKANTEAMVALRNEVARLRDHCDMVNRGR